MKSGLLGFLIIAALLTPVSVAAVDGISGLPAYAPANQVGGALAATGGEMMAGLMARWIRGFREFQPEVKVTFTSVPNLTPADRVALGDGVAEVFHTDAAPYIDKNLREPFRVMVSLGSFDTKGKIQGLGVYVHRDNPLTRLTLAQLDAIYSATRRRGFPSDIATWGDLGLSGPWANAPIHLYGRKLDQDVPWLFREVVLFGGTFKRSYRSPGKGGSVDVVDAVAADPRGITFVAFMHATSGVKALSIADPAGGDAPPTPAGLASGKYPLVRPLWLYVNRPPDAPLDPLSAEFLSYVLSRQGQALVAQDGYFPLRPDILTAERQKLK